MPRDRRDAPPPPPPPPTAVRQNETALFQKPLNITELHTRAKDRPRDFRKHTAPGNRG